MVASPPARIFFHRSFCYALPSSWRRCLRTDGRLPQIKSASCKANPLMIRAFDEKVEASAVQKMTVEAKMIGLNWSSSSIPRTGYRTDFRRTDGQIHG